MPEITLVEISVDADTIESDGYFSALQQALVARLKQEQGDEDDDRYPSALSILYDEKLEIENEIDQAVASIGAYLLVMTPNAQDNSPGVPIPSLDQIDIIIQAIENPLINRAEGGLEIPGGRLAWLVAEDLKRTIVDGRQISLGAIRQNVNEDAGLVAWHVHCKLSY